MAEELKEALRNVPDSYNDFVKGSFASVKSDEECQKKLLEYLRKNPEAQTDDVIDYIFDELVA